ncbi:hypothetical protein TNCV_2920721 [Trichonephila clavipes]|nr:hypothetical protein TNCV_2920721 [Trichonephila clavipes]
MWGKKNMREKMQFSVGNMGGYIQCHFSPKRIDRDIWNIERMLWVNDRLETKRKFWGWALVPLHPEYEIFIRMIKGDVERRMEWIQKWNSENGSLI